MRTAQISPLIECVSPKLCGTEKVISCLTEELLRQGHEVTFFASGDSIKAPSTAAMIARCGQKSMAHSRQVTFRQWKDRPLAEKLWEHAATLFGSQL